MLFRLLCHQDEQSNDDESEVRDVAARFPEPNPFRIINPKNYAGIQILLLTKIYE